MATTAAIQTVSRPKIDPKQRHEDIRLSDRVEDTLPHLLQSAPLIVHYLAHLRLVAYSDDALRIQLNLEGKGINRLRCNSIPTAIEQLVDKADDAFECSTKNMRAIEMNAATLFHKNGYVRANDLGLNDPKADQRRMHSALVAIQNGMKNCVSLATEIEEEFVEAREIAKDIKYALSGEAASFHRQQDEASAEKLQAEYQKAFQKTIESDLVKEADRAWTSMQKAEKQYDKQLNRSEFKDVGLKAVYDLEAGLSGLINASIGLVRDAPKIAMSACHAVGQLTGTPARLMSTPNSSAPDEDPVQPATQQQTLPVDVGIDPALLHAERIKQSIERIKNLVSQGLLKHFYSDSSELDKCSAQLQVLLAEIESGSSDHANLARQSIDAAVALIANIEEHHESARAWTEEHSEWTQKRAEWANQIRKSYADALKLMASSQSRPGHGFGTKLAAPAGVDGLLSRRHEKMLITRASLEAARNTLAHSTERRLEAQRRAKQLSADIQQLTGKQAKLGGIKQALKQAITNLHHFQTQVKSLVNFFNIISQNIEVIGKNLVQKQIDDGQSGVPRSGIAARALRSSLVEWRAHFLSVIDQPRLYNEIATSFILPSMEKAASLEISATPEEQEQARLELKRYTEGCAEAIGRLAEKESERIRESLDARIGAVDLEANMISFEEPLEDYERRALEAGVKDTEQATAALSYMYDTETMASSETMDFDDDFFA